MSGGPPAASEETKKGKKERDIKETAAYDTDDQNLEESRSHSDDVEDDPESPPDTA